MPTLESKLGLVTGSTRGIGSAIAAALTDHDARVIIHGRNPDEARRVCDELGAFAAISGDLATAEGCSAVLEQLADFDPVDVLINNAGVFGVADFFAIDDDEWLRYYQTNVMSVVRLSRALLAGMLERGYGRIVNVSSEAGIKPLPQMIHYSVTKTALISLSRGLAELTKGTAVTVNSLLPGPTWTAGVEEYITGLAAKEGKSTAEVVENYFREHEPTSLIQRFVSAEEVAQAALFLAGNGAANGSALRVEGGIIRSI